MPAKPHQPTPQPPKKTRFGIPLRSLQNWEPDEKLRQQIHEATHPPTAPVNRDLDVEERPRDH